MSKFSIIFTILIIVISGLFINDKFGDKIGEFVSSVAQNKSFEFLHKQNKPAEKDYNVELIDPPSEIPSQNATELNKPVIDDKVFVYFLSLDKNDNSVYKKTEKILPKGEEKIEFAVKSLLKGPDLIEKTAGAYSEIPQSTKLLSVKHSSNKVIIDLSSDFQYGGGTDSIYSRMMQLIKTSSANSDGKKVYLYLDGKQVNTLGGEGIMISQPLSESSLDI